MKNVPKPKRIGETPRKDAFERFCKYWNFGPWNASHVTVKNAEIAFKAGWNASRRLVKGRK